MKRQGQDRRTNKSNRMIRLAAALMVSGAASAIAIAPVHAQSNDASLRGTITASDGNMPTEVVAVEVETGYRRTATLSTDGSYNFPSLRPGDYWLEITTASGTRTTDVFTLNVGQSSTFDFDAAESGQVATSDDVDAGIEEGATIIVTGTRIKKMEGGEVGINITPRLIEALPQNNRNFLAFADLAPGVQFITAGNDQSRLQGGALGSNSVNIFIDGVGQKDYVLKNGVTGQDSTQGNPFPQMAVAEYRVISSNYKAEFDQVSSVAVTAVTKSGTNNFHGEGFVDFTNQDLRERRPNEIYPTRIDKVRTRDLQFGGALGGPIIKDVLHFFVTYEGKRRINPRDVNPGLSLPVSFFPSQYQDRFGPVNETFNENLYFGKINFAPTSKDMFEFSLKYRDESGETFNSGIAAYETRTLASVKEWRGLARWEHSEDTWINDFKVAYEDVSWGPRPFLEANRFVFNVRPNATTAPGNVLEVGGGTNFQDKGQKGWMVSDDFTYTGFEGHTIKFGVKAKWVTLNTIERNGFNPTFRYHTGLGAPFNDTIPYEMSFTAAAGGVEDEVSSKNFQFGIYLQDDWDVTDRLTLNLGLRWDYERTPAWLNYVHDPAQVAAVSPTNYPNLINADYNINDYISTGTERKAFKGAWQPRIGFSYKIDADGRFVLFGGYGRSYDRTQFDFLQQELRQSIAASRTFQFTGVPSPNAACTPGPTCIPWNPAYLTPEGRAALIAGLSTGAGREVRFIKNDITMPYTDQFSIGLRGNFGLLDAEIGFSHIASHNGFVFLLGNRRADGSFFPATGNPSSPFGINPSPFAAIIIGDQGIETRANTAYLKLTKRYTRASPWSIDATYTYTRANENRQFGEVFSLDYPSIEDYPFRRSSGVRTHRLVVAGTVDLPFDMVMAGKFQISSPAWQKRFTNVLNDPLSRDVVAIENDGNGDRWGFRQMDLSLTKNIRIGFPNDEATIWLRADIINLFNDRNYNSFNNVTGLRNPTAFGTDGPPRTIKVSAGFRF